MNDSASQPPHRVVAIFNNMSGAAALAEIVRILEGHDLDTNQLSLRRLPGESLIEVRADILLSNGSITAVLRELGENERVSSASAENLASRSTFILPV